MLKDMKDMCVGYYVVMLTVICVCGLMNYIQYISDDGKLNYQFIAQCNFFALTLFTLVCIRRIYALFKELRNEKIN